MDDMIYTGPYKVVKMYRVSGKRVILERGLSRVDAMAVVNSHLSSKNSIVMFEKQYTASKYYVQK